MKTLIPQILKSRQLVLFLCAACLAFIWTAALNAQEPQSLPPHPVFLKFMGQGNGQGSVSRPVVRFMIEVADEPEERQIGLMHRTDLAPSTGMLFIFDTNRAISMWMENTPLPLDMVFLDRAGTIVNIVRGTTPFSRAIISSGQPVSYVLELNAGIAARTGLAVGDLASHPVITANMD
ncbi:MAG: hypothetical protein COA52_08915 [Hyphomicrobiales bacterium]|nr:MAG: hypothetical protein COA52_08915 [Hyphomicrobiales bacterium]